MYIAFGNEVLDSDEIKQIIEENSDLKVLKDMSKGSKREDIVAFNVSIDVEILKEEIRDTCELEEIEEDELFEEYLAVAEELAVDVEEFLPEESIIQIAAYKLDGSTNAVNLVIAIAHESLTEVKLRDIMKRLLTQVE